MPRAFGLITLLVALFIVWVSAIPFDFRPVPAGEIIESVYGIGRPLPSHLSRADILANGLAFAVFGLFAMATLALDRRGVVARLSSLAAVMASGLLLSVSVEFAQVFLPGRESSVADVCAHVAGTFAGATTFLLVGERLVDWLRLLASEREHPSVILRLLTLYAAGVAAWRLFPFDFTVRPGALWRKFESGQIALLPFGTLAGSPDAVAGLVEVAFAGVPLGALAALLGVRPGRRRPVVVATLLAAAFLALLEGWAACMASGTADTGNILLGAAGAFVGAVVVGQLSDREIQRPMFSRQVASLWAGVLIWVGVMTAYEWNPFTFRFTKEAIKDGLGRLTLLPFGFYARGAPPTAFLNMTLKTLLAVPLGSLLGLAVGRHSPSIRRSGRVILTCAAVAGLLTFLETGQVFLPERVPDLTDVLLPAAAAAVAAWLVTSQR